VNKDDQYTITSNSKIDTSLSWFMLIGGQMTNDDSMIQDDQRQDASKLSKAYISQSQSQ